MNRQPNERRRVESEPDGRRSGSETPGGQQVAEVAAGDDSLVCTSCGAQVPEGSRSCPVCHRGVYRTCFCGWQLPANEPTCPNCGADWSQSARVARKSRSRSPRTQTLLRHAVIGALVASAIALIVFGLVSGLAKLGLPEASTMPASVGERLALAVSGVAEAFRRIGGFFIRHGRLLLSILGILLAGALGGVGMYLWKLKHRGRSNHTSRTTRRVRRKKR